MIATILIILGIYLLFRFVDEGLGMFDSLSLTIRRLIAKRRKTGARQPEDNHWKGIIIGFFIGVIFMLLIIVYSVYYL